MGNMKTIYKARVHVLPLAAALLFAAAFCVKGQLVDSSQVSPTVPLGTIEESTAEQIGAGRGDVHTPLSSVYLIKRDPARAIRRGRQLFQRKFTFAQGLGPRVNPHSRGDIMENPALGAGISDSCAGCHGRPKGAAGFGGLVTTRPDSRDAPHLFGLGLQEMLADEMTTELRNLRDEAVAQAQLNGTPQEVFLDAKGVSFGRITVQADGSIEATHIEGVDEDLRVRPFFAQGGAYSIREFVIGAFKDEMGLQAVDPDLWKASHGRVVTSPAGLVLDGTTDVLDEPPVRNKRHDGDRDGVRNEIDTAIVDFLEFYLLNYFKPGIGKQTVRTVEGQALLHSVNCTSCHVPNMTIERDRRIADVDTRFDPVQGRFNRLFATASTRFMILEDGDPYPQLLPEEQPFEVENIYSDLKRHDLGPRFHERNFDGSLQKEFVTEPLWGVGSTSPYGHDGRCINLEEVILRHGGEAQASRDAFAALSGDDQAKLMEFLQTLILFPPDDTASNLNPGDDAEFIQDPAGHGNINLGALFQIEDLTALPPVLEMEPGEHPHRPGRICWFGFGGRRYHLQCSVDLVHWRTLHTITPENGEMVEFDIPDDMGHAFFRLHRE